jgi:hypothetical protein
MKALLTVVALAMLVSSPALANRAGTKSYVRSGKLLMQVTPTPAGPARTGWDPDINIRQQIEKDAPNFH